MASVVTLILHPDELDALARCHCPSLANFQTMDTYRVFIEGLRLCRGLSHILSRSWVILTEHFLFLILWCFSRL